MVMQGHPGMWVGLRLGAQQIKAAGGGCSRLKKKVFSVPKRRLCTAGVKAAERMWSSETRPSLSADTKGLGYTCHTL